MKVGLFVNTQFPAGFNLPERVPEMSHKYARRVMPASHLCGSRITG
jgi:hypothetical protein